MSTAREKIFADIRAALGPLPTHAPRPAVPHGVADAQWLGGGAATVPLFLQRAEAAGTVCFSRPEDCLSWLTAQQVRKIFIPASQRDLVELFSTKLEVTTEYRREEVDVIDAALTPAAGAIAESGSIVLSDQASPDRLAELAPWIHLALVRRETIHRSLADALAAMPDDPNVIWVTGPSKTADVEGILIKGVHGPGIQCCLLL